MKSLKQQASYETGLAAEKLAISHYESMGYTLLKRRYKTKAGEIDAILNHINLLIFLEVKARKTYSEGAESITPKAKARLLAAAEIFLAENQEYVNKDVRFDVAIITTTLDIIENAFQ